MDSLRTGHHLCPKTQCGKSQDQDNVTEGKEDRDTQTQLPQNKPKAEFQFCTPHQRNWTKEKSSEFIQIWSNIGQESPIKPQAPDPGPDL